MTLPLPIAAFAGLVFLAASSIAAPATTRVFDPAGRPPTHAIAMARHTSPPDRVPDSPMLRQIAGVVAELNGRDLAQLRRSVNTQTRVPGDVRVREHIATLHLSAADASTRVELARVEHGWLMARSLETGVAVRLEESAAAAILSTWPRPRPAPPSDPLATPEPGEIVTLAGPHTPSPIRLDQATVSSRFGRRNPPPLTAPLTRDLAHETFRFRRPVGHRPDRPAGLLVWISPENEADLPDAIFEAADKAGLICITPTGIGDDRPSLDRFQLVLDAVAIASASWWVDPDRVFIAGFSGGARAASTLLACFPDVFTGAVCAAGLDSHHRVSVGDGRSWPKAHDIPTGELGRMLRHRRVAVITGPRDQDFNEIRGRVRLLQRDGLPFRVFDFADQTHAMPKPDRLLTTLEWVDQPRADAFEASARQARSLLDRYRTRRGDAGPEDEADARLLERVTVVGPWTEPAWHAARLLGYETGEAP